MNMEIFNVPRGCGKTTHLIMEATKTGCPIVVGLQTQKKYLEETIKKITDKHVDVYTVQEILNMKNKPKDILIDELPLVLNILLDCNVIEATMKCMILKDGRVEKLNFKINNKRQFLVKIKEVINESSINRS